MTLTNAYLTLAEFKAIAGKDTIVNDNLCELAIMGASRAINAFTGRRFYKDTSATARTIPIRYVGYREAAVYDFHTTTGLVVETDTGDDGTFETTWAAADYELEPANGIMGGIEGWPFTTIRAVEGRTFPVGGKRRRLRVTAQWGWAAVPDDVKQACASATHDFYKAKDAPFGIAGIDNEFVARIRANPQIRALLGPYMSGRGAGSVMVG